MRVIAFKDHGAGNPRNERYVNEDFGVELANTVYALDATTIDLCLSMFPWAPFRSTKAAVKSLLDLSLRTGAMTKKLPKRGLPPMHPGRTSARGDFAGA